MKRIFNIILLCVFGFSALGQSTFKQNHDFGLGLSYAPKEFNVALSWKQLHPITSNQKFKLGYGLRFNGYVSNDKDYITAPAELTSGETGPQVFFIENIEENLDTFSLHNAQHNSINAVIHLEYAVNEQWSVGFNIDAAGFSFGGSRDGQIISSNNPTSAIETVSAKPTAYNVLLVSDNDIGMLNSELFAAYNVSSKLAIHAGFTFLFTEYTTENEISYNFNNDRFRHKSLMGLVSIHIKPFNN